MTIIIYHESILFDKVKLSHLVKVPFYKMRHTFRGLPCAEPLEIIFYVFFFVEYRITKTLYSSKFLLKHNLYFCFSLLVIQSKIKREAKSQSSLHSLTQVHGLNYTLLPRIIFFSLPFPFPLPFPLEGGGIISKPPRPDGAELGTFVGNGSLYVKMSAL